MREVWEKKNPTFTVKPNNDIEEAIECLIDLLKAVRREQAIMRDSVELLQVWALGQVRKYLDRPNHEDFLLSYAKTVLNMDEGLAKRVINDLERSDQLNSPSAGHC